VNGSPDDPNAHHFHRHRRCNSGRVVVHKHAVIEIAHAGLGEELITAPPRKVREPCAARIIIGLLVARPERNDARGHVADRSRLSQYFLHTRIWVEGLALLNADGCQQPKRFRV
jgi:hypothetical protein